MSAETRTWEEVLAAVEADARIADAMLHGDAGAVGDTAGHQAHAAPVVLPPLTEMPDVPKALRGRIEQLRSQIDELSAELAAVLRDWPAAATLPAGRRAAPRAHAARHLKPSQYVDRLV